MNQNNHHHVGLQLPIAQPPQHQCLPLAWGPSHGQGSFRFEVPSLPPFPISRPPYHPQRELGMKQHIQALSHSIIIAS